MSIMNNQTPNHLPDPRTVAFESINTERLGLVLGLENRPSRRPHPVLMAAAGALLSASGILGANHVMAQDAEITQPAIAFEQEIIAIRTPELPIIEVDDIPRTSGLSFPRPVISPTPIPEVLPPAPAPVVEVEPAPVVVAAPPPQPPAPVPAPVQAPAPAPKPVAPAYPSNSTYGQPISTKITSEILETGVPYWVKTQTGDHMDEVTLRASSGMAPGQAFAVNQTIRYRDCDKGTQMTVKAGTSASRIVQELNKYNWPITIEQLTEWNGGNAGLKLIAGYCIRIAK